MPYTPHAIAIAIARIKPDAQRWLGISIDEVRPHFQLHASIAVTYQANALDG